MQDLDKIYQLLFNASAQLAVYNKCGGSQHKLLQKAMDNIEDALKELED